MTKAKSSTKKSDKSNDSKISDYFTKQSNVPARDLDASSTTSSTRGKQKMVLELTPKSKKSTKRSANQGSARPVRRSPRKKQRLNDSDEHILPTADTKPVPSSQCDEEELALRDLDAFDLPVAGPSTLVLSDLTTTSGAESAGNNSRQASPLSSLSSLNPATPDPLVADGRVDEVSGRSSPLTSPDEGALTPPPSSPPRAQDITPIPLDSRMKTDMIIAQMRREAEALVAQEMLEEKGKMAVDFPDVLDDSSDEEEDFMFTFRSRQDGAGKEGSPTPGSSKIASSSRLTDQGALPQPSSLRNASLPPGPTQANRPVRNSNAPSRLPVTLAVKPAEPPAKKAVNPLDALLKEKRANERKGRGESAFLLAEKNDRERSMSVALETDDETLHDAEAAEAAAKAGIARRMAKGMSDDEDFDDIIVTPETRNHLLGQEAGEAVGKILEQDKKEAGIIEEKPCGVEVFAQVDENYMETEEPLPCWEAYEGERTVFSSLRKNLATNDISQATSGLQGSLILSDSKHATPDIVRVLNRLALMTWHPALVEIAESLIYGWALSKPSKDVWPITAHYVASTLARQGMKHEFLAQIVSTNLSMVTISHPDSREEVLHALVDQIETWGNEECVDIQEIAGVSMALLFITVNVNSSPALRIDAARAFSSLARLLPTDNVSDTEIEVARRALAFLLPLPFENQRYTLDCFFGGSKLEDRIRRRVAFHLITGLPFDIAGYAELPSLEIIISTIEDSAAFTTSKDTDYNALMERVRILSHALSGIEDYVILETTKTSRMTSTEAMQHTTSRTPLERIIKDLMNLHGSISDTQAAHLDRTHAKGWIQTLQMRVHYQRESMKSQYKPRRKGPQRIDEMLASGSTQSANSLA